MSNFWTRVITALFFGATLIASVIINQYAFIAVFFIITALCLNEFYTLLEATGKSPQTLSGLFIGTLLFVSITLLNLQLVHPLFLLTDILLIFGIFILELYRKGSDPFGNIAFTILGIVYLAIPFSAFTALGFLITDGYQWQLPMGFLLLLWASDTGAYLFGIKFGKTRLFERISPKKSWEGFIGGMATSLFIAWALSKTFLVLSVQHWLTVSFLIVTTGTLGDLVESMFKRSIDAKDSGSLLPGHGGVLDRFDGLFISAPVVFIYLYLIRYFGVL